MGENQHVKGVGNHVTEEQSFASTFGRSDSNDALIKTPDRGCDLELGLLN